MADRPTIEITAELIEGAKPADSSHCMIADAIKQAIPDAEQISVDLATIRYSDRKRGKRYVMLTPPVAQQHLLWFDQADERLKPFTFTLPRPAQTVKAAKAKRSTKRMRGMPAKHKPATVVTTAGGSSVPEKRGGTVPPLGALAGGDAARTSNRVRTGRVRAFGLRSMARE